jgi:hypothetical protein
MKLRIMTNLKLQNRIFNYYLQSKDKNLDLLLEYTNKINIYDKVKTIMEVMTKY